MDLKSMLNDSGQRPPRIHTHSSHSQTPQPSYDVRLDHTPGSDASSARPTPYPYGPPSQILDSRAHGGGSAGTGGNGSYFAIHSPHPNTSTSASTPSAGPHSAYAQSPGSFMGPYTPRENISIANTATAAHGATFVSPTPTHQPIPPTPSSIHQHNYSRSTSYNNSSHPHNHAQFQSPPPQMNGLPPSAARHSSPIHQFQSQPATPLGPPIHYPKASPQSYRPPSQGHESHLRRASQSSISSVLSNRDYPQYPPPLPAQLPRRSSTQGSYGYDSRDRERSISVSPKTIPKPPPQRGHDPPRNLSHDRTSNPSVSEPVTRPPVSHQNSLELQPASTPDSQFPPPNPAMYNSPQASRSSEQPMQQPYESMASSNDVAVVSHQHASLKRRASHLSDTVTKPPQKKPRRDEIPVWARLARNPEKQKPLRFVEGRAARNPPPQQPAPSQTAPTQPPHREPPLPLPKSNGNSIVPKPIDLPQSDQPNIANRVQFDILTPTICEWVLQFIGRADPPPGSKFEIEAKVGVIIRNDTDSRLEPMVWTEAVLTEQAVHNTKFHSGMTLDQHRVMNEYLNDLVRQNTAAGHVGTPNEIFYSHPKENDEFYELSEEGKKHLPSELHHWIMKGSHAKRRNEIRVRRTVDKATGAVTAQIIKTRIADINITCPQDRFDYRISISLETDWEGDTAWLTPLAETRGRNKDRMSYRHRMYQVDLTQVSHEDSRNLEHELEVEIATEFLQRELQRLRATGESSLYEVVHGLISNIRLFTKLGQ